MEISSSVKLKQQGGWLGFGVRRYRAGPMEYRDKGHIQYYSMKKKDGIECCLSLKEKKKKKKKKWLLEDVVVAEEKQRKRLRKQAKRMMKMNIVEESSSSESSESSESSSDSYTTYMMMRSKAKKKQPQEEEEKESILAKLALTLPLTVEQQPHEEEEKESILAKLTLTFPLTVEQEAQEEESILTKLASIQKEEETRMVTGVKVCMGNKCKKMGAEALMADWQTRLGDPAAVVPCKCMGKCKSAPNVTLFHHSLHQPPLLLPA